MGSKLINQFVNSEISTETALKNLIVLLHKLGNKELEMWARKELGGYQHNDTLPHYRIVKGRLLCDYIIGGGLSVMKYTNMPFPLVNLTEKQKEMVLGVNIHQSISSLESMKDSNNQMANELPAEGFGLLSMGTNANIIKARVYIDNLAIQDIIAMVNENILNILIKLDDEFGNIDGLSIDLSIKNDEEIKEIKKELLTIIYNDNSITLGDNNIISDSTLLTETSGDRENKKGLIKKLFKSN